MIKIKDIQLISEKDNLKTYKVIWTFHRTEYKSSVFKINEKVGLGRVDLERTDGKKINHRITMNEVSKRKELFKEKIKKHI